MTEPVRIDFVPVDLDALAGATGRIALFAPPDATAGAVGRGMPGPVRAALTRLFASEGWGKLKAGEAAEVGFPAGLAADALIVVKLPRRATVAEARKGGASVAKARGTGDLWLLTGQRPDAAQIAFGLALRAYAFTARKSAPTPAKGRVTVMAADPEGQARAAQPLAALAEGVIFTRDLVSEPANILTTDDFAARLAAMQDLGLDVEILEEDELKRLGMGSLLCVGQGSASPSKVVVMQWRGAGDDSAPFALIGKGVVFDTGGISIKPAAGMEDMTMDMGGAGVVAGVMRTLALRRAKANVVGLVGLVENMPSGTATRPGDVVTSMKGDTIEVINTDAEGRLVLADVLWYAQERFKPVGMINLATLTGAIIVALGHENAGVFSNNDALCDAFLAAARAEEEGAWRMPMGEGYDAALKSNIADMKNVGGRDGGSITAAQFLKRFVKDDVPWCHLDIAGVTLLKSDTTLAPKGATGWGVRALNRLIADRYEAKVKVGEVYFYHMTADPLERMLPRLLTQAMGRGWRVEVRGTSAERAAWLDQALWGPEDAFLPHGLAGGPHDGLQPVLLTDRPLGGLPCVMAVDGADIPPPEVAALDRACILFDGNDPDATALARNQWRGLTGAGLGAQYWAQENGGWVMKQQRKATA